jgi:Glycosyltransferase family 87
VVSTWVITRVLMLVLFATAESFVIGDVLYYWRKVAAMGDVGLSQTLNEYPTPVVWILSLPYGLGLGSSAGYAVAFIAMMIALDGVFTWSLWRFSGRRHGRALDFWLLFVPLIGPLSYLRFDILPAVLAGGALLAARRRAWITGALTGLGAAIKLWPALLIAAFLAHRPDRKAAGIAFIAVGFGLALLSLIAGGWTRLVSPLTWQSGRGLQIESIWATPLMIARAIAPEKWRVDMSRFQAFEVFGPGVDALLVISNIATVVGLLAIIALWVRAYSQPDPSAIGIGLIIVATVAIMTVTNKTLSPQYLLWLGGPVAALLVIKRDSSSLEERMLVRRLARQTLLLAALTQLVYPLLYDGLLHRQGDLMLVVSTVVTSLRNLALLAFSVEVTAQAWRALHRAPVLPAVRS